MPLDLMLELEHTTCCMCGGREGQPRMAGRDVEFLTCGNWFTFVECAGCGHLYLSPRPRVENMDVIYAGYLTTNTESAYHPSPLVASIKNRMFDVRRMRPILGTVRAGSKVLDIGAGAGRLLRLLRSVSRVPLDLYANEIRFDEGARRSLEEDQIRLIEGPIEQFVTAERFDAMTSVHVIEHVVDPRAVFGWMAEHLNPGGVLYLETPDAGAFCRRIFGSEWGMTHFPRHFNLFTKTHLAALASDAGLSVRRQGNTTSAPAWNMSIRNRLKMDALSKHRSAFELFNYSNLATLGAFTLVDCLLLACRVPTSTQTLVAVKPG